VSRTVQGLLVNLLEHEVLEPALLGHDRVPGDALGVRLDGVALEVRHAHRVLGEHGQLAVAEEEDVARVLEDGGHVGGDEVLAVAEADDDGRPLPDGDDRVRLFGRDDREREDAAQVAHR
jgi:hypothetical protein